MNLCSLGTYLSGKKTIRNYRKVLDGEEPSNSSRKRKREEPLNYWEIAPTLLGLFSRFPSLLSETEMYDDLRRIRDRITQLPSIGPTRESILFSRIIDHPIIEVQLAKEKIKVSTAILASHSEMVSTQLCHENPDTLRLTLTDFSWSKFQMAMEFYKNPKSFKIPPENAWELLHLADLLQSKNLSAACIAVLQDHIQTLDVLQLEVVQFAVESLNDPICAIYPQLASFLENVISGFFKLSFICTPEAHYHTVRDFIKEKLTRFISIDLGLTRIDKDSLSELSDIKINALRLNQCECLDSSCLAVLKRMPRLKDLDLESNNWVDDKFLAELAQMDHLSILHLNFCDNLTSRGIQHLPPSLEELSLEYCKGIGDEAIPSFLKMTNLKTLDLTETGFTEAGVARLREVIPRVWFL